MKAINISVDDDLKGRLDIEAQRQKRSQRAIVEIALERYFEQIEESAFPFRIRRLLRRS